MAKIYTKKGDKGTTGLYRGERVSKSSPQIEINGAVDEAQSFIGLARSELLDCEELNGILKHIEKDLWILMAEVATTKSAKVPPTPGVDQVNEIMVKAIEVLIDEFAAKFRLPKQFVVTGENRAAAQLDVARAVVRRAERIAVAYGEYVDDGYVIIYLNRLSDLLWTLARYVENGSLFVKDL